MSAGRHKDKSRKASKNARTGKYAKAFARGIKKRGRWRGHKFTTTDQLRGGSVSAKPKTPGSNKPVGNHIQY